MGLITTSRFVLLINDFNIATKKKKKKISRLLTQVTQDDTFYKQCCGAGAGRSRGFLAGVGADLKFELEPIFWVGSGSFF